VRARARRERRSGYRRARRGRTVPLISTPGGTTAGPPSATSTSSSPSIAAGLSDRIALMDPDSRNPLRLCAITQKTARCPV
jgi:hypothetical protein